MNLRALGIVSILLAVPRFAATSSYPGVTVLNHPGGGTIAYAAMPGQHTAQGAINRVMGYVAARFGATPKVSHVLKSKDGNSLAVTFTIKSTTETPGDMTGLALVAVTASGPGKGAVLSDQSSRFGTTVADMLKQMEQLASGASSTTAPAASGATGPPAAPAMTAAAPAAPIGALHPTPFPDGSGTVGLPDGWKIVGAHAGEVIAKGAPPAQLHFNFLVNAYDPSKISANSRMQIGPGSHAISYDADIVTKFNLISAQNAQSQHTAPPAVKLLATRQMGANSYLIVDDVTPSDGSVPFRAYIQIFVSPLSPAGTYFLTMYQVLLPQSLSNEQGNTAVKALFDSYKPDVQRAQSEIAAANAQNRAITNNFMATSERNADASQRAFAADDNALLGNTIVRDRNFNEHGVVSDNLADALTQADPNRFQEVPPSQFIKGVDY